jgi:hypothetical protein
MATALFLRSFAWAGAITLAMVLSCYGQTVKPNEVVKWDGYTFKFGPSAQMAQVNPNAGRTRIAMYKDAAAAITLGASPKFCIAFPTHVRPEVLQIGTVGVKKDHRELELTHADKTWMPPKRLQAADVKRISDTVVEILPKEPLPPGQYVLGGPPTIGVYDFGVEANKADGARCIGLLARRPAASLGWKRCRSFPT